MALGKILGILRLQIAINRLSQTLVTRRNRGKLDLVRYIPHTRGPDRLIKGVALKAHVADFPKQFDKAVVDPQPDVVKRRRLDMAIDLAAQSSSKVYI